MNLSKIEKAFLKQNHAKPNYGNEKVVTLVAENIKELGRLTALRFIEWVHDNPSGVIALPTGKTPEYFIKYLKFFKRNWHKQSIQDELNRIGLKINNFPDTSELKFVQLDEFFPINPNQENSFTFYVKKHYLKFLKIKKENSLIIDTFKIDDLKHNYQRLFPNNKIDLTLLNRPPISKLEEKQKEILQIAQNFCKDYEAKIRSLGGIGFFLGGIGPDGHIAFNTSPSEHSSVTRLVKLNYPSQAAVAEDLGGIDIARNLAAITIGLGTITYNPKATIIIIAAGEAKAHQVSKAIEELPSPENPATALQKTTGTRFYLTKGAASKLHARAISDMDHLIADLTSMECKEIPEFPIIEEVIIGLALRLKKSLSELTEADFYKDDLGALLLPKIKPILKETIQKIATDLTTKLAKNESFFKNKKILHTSPHHDDLILSYWPIIKNCLADGKNKIIYFTSGFRGISDNFIKNLIKLAKNEFICEHESQIFNNSYKDLLVLYAKNYKTDKNLDEIDLLIFLKIVAEVFQIKGNNRIKRLIYTLKKIEKEYLLAQYFDNKKNLNLAILKTCELLQLTASDYLFSIKNLKAILKIRKEPVIFTRSLNELLQNYQNETNETHKNTIFSLCVLKIFSKNLNITSLAELKEVTKKELLQEKFCYHKIKNKIGTLKSRIRELEAEKEWQVSAAKKPEVKHLRLHFYQGKIFNPLPNIEDDIKPVIKEVTSFKPEIITVAFDPEGTGPDTHYKALQIIAETIKKIPSDVIILGYRNIWHRFKFFDANLFYPVNEQELEDLKRVFLNCFSSQKKAEFPSFELDAPFSDLAAKIQMDQLKKLKILLGADYFKHNPHLKNAIGLVMLKLMSKEEFLKSVIELKKSLT